MIEGITGSRICFVQREVLQLGKRNPHPNAADTRFVYLNQSLIIIQYRYEFLLIYISIFHTRNQYTVGLNTAAAPEQQKVDVLSMHNRTLKGSQLAEKEEVMIDSGEGKVEIWRVEENHKVPVNPACYGQFYDGESYLVLYGYIWKNKDCHLIYFWQGRNSRYSLL